MYEAHRQTEEAVKVYFLLHADTVEEQSYLTTLRREKEAFEYLIQTKSVSGLLICICPHLNLQFLDYGDTGRSRW